MAKLRILATTDLHGHLLPYDYVKDQPTQSGGLAGLATLIKDARAEAATQNMHVLLLDNGDTFQGTPLATHLANGKVGPDHPIVASFNHLQFDALGLGNHDLDHGLPYLKAVASAVEIPFLSSNLKGADLSPLRSNLLLDINVGTDPPAPLKVGILSVLPEQSAAWNSHHLGPCADIIDPVQSLSAQAEALRKEGADLIVILAHMGVGHDEGSDNRAAQALAETGNVDALILGHTHRRFPSTDYAERRGVDIQTSTVGHVPAVMAGHGGSDLAVMDLQLSLDKRLGWKIDSHRCTLRVNDASVAPDPTICALAKGTHDAATALMNKPLATIPRDLHSYFSLAAPAPTQLLTARAHFNLVQSALAGTADAALPLLATSAAHGAGGRDGISNFMYIPRGPVLRRHVAGLLPYANQVVAIRTTGHRIKMWLEHAALIFNTLHTDAPHQMLTNECIPAFQFDTIFGLQYQIDPSSPPFERISEIQFEGAPVRPTQDFMLATTQFRAAGGGGYTPTPPAQVVTSGYHALHDALVDVLDTATRDPWEDRPAWRFAPLDCVEAVLLTHPDAIGHLRDISHLLPMPLGTTSDGFIQLRITL